MQFERHSMHCIGDRRISGYVLTIRSATWVFVRMVAEGRGGEKKPRPITSFAKAWKSACRAAGCPGRIPHDLRRTAVRAFVRRRIPDGVAMALSGHRTRSVFDRYNITSTGDLQDAKAKLDGPTLTATAHA